MSRYRHFTMDERESLLGYLKQGKKNCEIAKLLSRSPSTISREIRRNTRNRSQYSAIKAQKAYEHRRKRSVRKCKLAEQDFAKKFLNYWKMHGLLNKSAIGCSMNTTRFRSAPAPFTGAWSVVCWIVRCERSCGSRASGGTAAGRKASAGIWILSTRSMTGPNRLRAVRRLVIGKAILCARCQMDGLYCQPCGACQPLCRALQDSKPNCRCVHQCNGGSLFENSKAETSQFLC